MIEQVLITTTADNTQAENEYKGLKTEIKDLKKQLDLLEEGTEEYNKTFTKLSDKMFQQKERMEALRNSSADLGKVLQNSSAIMGTLTQGLAAGVSGLSLFGVESEQLLKVMQKVQALESISKFFSSLEDAPKKVKALIQNIQGLLNQKGNQLELKTTAVQGTVTPQGVTQQAVAVDTKAVEQVAKSSQVIAGANLSAAGAASTNAANQALISKENAKQLALEKAKNDEYLKASILLKQTSAQMQADNAKRNIENEYKTTFSDDEISKLSSSKDVDSFKESQKNLKEYDSQLNNVGKSIDNNAQKTTAWGKVTTGLGKLWGNLKGIISGVGIGLAIGAAIAGITMLIKYFKDLGEARRKAFEESLKFNEEQSKSIESAGGKEIAMLKVLTVGYNNLSKDKKKQQKFLEDNKESYKKIGVEIDKIIKGEVTYTSEIKKANQALIDRANVMGTVNLLMNKFSQQAEIENNRILNAQTIYKDLIKRGVFSDISNNISVDIKDKITKNVAELIARGSINADEIAKTVGRNLNIVDKNILSTISSFVDSRVKAELPKDFKDKIKEENDSLTVLNEQIAELEKKVGTFKLETNKAGDSTGKATVVIKNYSELLADINALYQGINLNNPFTPEKLRQAEESFNKVKIAADESIKAITQNENLSNEERLYKIAETNQLVVIAEKQLIQVRRQIQLDNAKWERDNQLRIAKEQKAIQKNTYKQTIEDALASLKAGVIKIEQFNEIFKSVQNAAGTSFKTVKEFFDYLGGNEIINRNDTFTSSIDEIIKGFTTIKDGVENIDVEAFKNKIKELYGANIDVENPMAIDLGTLSIDEFNYLQLLKSYYDAYNKSKQDIIIQSNEETKENTKKGYDIQLDLLDKLLADSERKIDINNAKIRTKMNERNASNTFKRGGAFDINDEIKIYENEIERENALQESINKTIDALKAKLLEENLTVEQREETVNRLKELDADLTESEERESLNRQKIKELERQKRQAILDGSIQAAQDVATILNNIYEASETTELNNLKRLLNAKTITQEQYEEKSEALANEYAKKRKRIEIFQGLLSATSSSIGAFASAMRPDSGLVYPYNLIAAGISSAAAFSAVIAQVATLKSLSIGDTSVTPTNTTAGGGLNYQLQEQQVSNERLLNSLTSQRVYVVESDITSAQARVTQVQEMSTF